MSLPYLLLPFFFLNDTAPTEISTLSLHDALPICNRLVYFVRQGGSQLSHGGHAADVCEIRLRLPQHLFSLLALNRDTREMGDSLYDIMLLRAGDRQSTRLNSSHTLISYALFCFHK